MHWKFESLPYDVSTHAWIRRARRYGYVFALQSGATAPGQRYDLIAADPHTLVSVRDGHTWLETAPKGERTRVDDDPFRLIDRLVKRNAPADFPYDLPFAGGAIGWFGYELAYRLERIGEPVDDTLSMPDLMVGLFDWFIARDHVDRSACLIATPGVPELAFERIRTGLMETVDGTEAFRLSSAITSSLSRRAYNAAIGRIKHYIENGDCYQVNFAQRFEANFDGDALDLYQFVFDDQQSPYGACLLTPEVDVLSFSPERFVRVSNGTVKTQPIKGTRRRAENPTLDARLAQELVTSEKDRAENLMIVDLLRNDLGKCCVPGSISVEKLFELQSFENVHHLVSTIHGRLRNHLSPMDLLRACFPGGSITGAPKVRAMEIIRELEPCRRGPYCGAIGYYSYNGNLDTNLSIRTMALALGRVRYWGGGGIVADSTAADEYQESLDKVEFIRRALERRPDRSAAGAQRSRRSRGTAGTPR